MLFGQKVLLAAQNGIARTDMSIPDINTDASYCQPSEKHVSRTDDVQPVFETKIVHGVDINVLLEYRIQTLSPPGQTQGSRDVHISRMAL
jgi:hypothetical protein